MFSCILAEKAGIKNHSGVAFEFTRVGHRCRWILQSLTLTSDYAPTIQSFRSCKTWSHLEWIPQPWHLSVAKSVNARSAKNLSVTGVGLWLANDLQSFPCFGFLINKRHYGAKFDGLVDDPSASCRSGCGVVSCVILDAGGAAGTGKWRCREIRTVPASGHCPNSDSSVQFEF